MSDTPRDKDMDRREFLRRAAGAGLGLAAAGALSWGLYTDQPPAARPNQGALVRPPDFSLSAAAGRLALVRGADRAKALAAGLKAVGGMEAFVKKGEVVLIKPNAAFASPPLLGATTHPDLLAAVIQACYAAGAAKVLVTDNPINDPLSCFRLSGLAKAAADHGAELVLPTPDRFQPTSLEGGRLIRDWPLLYEPLSRADKLIGLAPVKDHHRSGASLSLKNFYGLLGGQRNIFHQDINGIIAELAALIRPSLVILDGVTSMQRNGPTGGSLEDLKQTNLLAVSSDPVAADAWAAGLLGKTPADLPWLALAQKAGAGTVDYRSLNPQEVSV